MPFINRDTLVLVLGVIILICGLILMTIWVIESIQTVIRRSNEDDLDDTIEYEFCYNTRPDHDNTKGGTSNVDGQ